MRSDDIPEVRSLQLFASMEESAFDELIRHVYLQNFPAHTELVSESDPADFLHIVVEGCVELFSCSNGRETTLGMVRPFGTFILAAVLKDAVYLMSARTTQRCRVLMIPAMAVRNAFEQDDAFARAIVLELASCYRAAVKEHKDLKLRTAVERLANRLLRYHIDQGETGELTLPFEKKTLASLLSMTPENLSRTFNTLKPYGVRLDGNRIFLTDLPSLQTLAKPNALIDDRST